MLRSCAPANRTARGARAVPFRRARPLLERPDRDLHRWLATQPGLQIGHFAAERLQNVLPRRTGEAMGVQDGVDAGPGQAVLARDLMS
jgi:hypothetical protein